MNYSAAVVSLSITDAARPPSFTLMVPFPSSLVSCCPLQQCPGSRIESHLINSKHRALCSGQLREANSTVTWYTVHTLFDCELVHLMNKHIALELIDRFRGAAARHGRSSETLPAIPYRTSHSAAITRQTTTTGARFIAAVRREIRERQTLMFSTPFQ